jgi:regulation of enolase protein 1 (concanavalin A-like superfamily)
MRLVSIICLLISASALDAQDGTLGLFNHSADVGSPAVKGSATFLDGQYRMTGSGSNIWGKQDQFRFAWREMMGNFSLTATVRFLGKGAEHRKAGIMVRQSIDPGAAYADVVVHGNGMPSLQWRSKAGDDTNTFDLPFDGPGPVRIRLVRNDVKIYMYVAKGEGEPQLIDNTEVSFRDPVFVGLIVCSHQADASDTAVFSDVSVESQAPSASKTR